jgi:hypothetical protein
MGKRMIDPICQNCRWWRPNQDGSDERECYNPRQPLKLTDDKFGCELFLGADATEVNVPQHTPKGTMNFVNATPVNNVEILIVTYAKDFPWLEYALKCIQRHAKGFHGVTIAIPYRDLDTLINIRISDVYTGPCIIRTYYEPVGKGFLNHEMMMARADELVPTGTKFVMHMDADCMMKMSNVPGDYFLNDKPMYLWRTWDSLSSPDPRDPTQKVVSDCIMWKEPTEAQLGYPSTDYTMCRHPTVFPIGFYPAYRDYIAKTHGKSFEDYMLSGNRNTHPQDRMDFTAMGQFARTFMRDDFHWINCAEEEYPADRMKAYWSHGGILPEIRDELEGFLK